MWIVSHFWHNPKNNETKTFTEYADALDEVMVMQSDNLADSQLSRIEDSITGQWGQRRWGSNNLEWFSLSNAAAALGRKGGASTSPAKQDASRENGKRGGRPPKPTPDLLPIGSRVTLNAKRSTRLNGRTATITAVEPHSRQLYYRVEQIDGLNTSRLYKIGDVIPR